MKTIKAEHLSNLRMAAGGERRVRFVIDRGLLMEWVGIGWVEVRRATARDRRQYRKVNRA